MIKKYILPFIALLFGISIFSGCGTIWVARPGGETERMIPYTAIVFREGDNVRAMDSVGVIRAGTDTGKSVSDVIQQAVDLCKKGGEVRIKAGEYRLERSVVVDYPCTISGEGRGTILVPPANQFAFCVQKTQRSPVLSDWVWGDKKGKMPQWLDDLCAERLYGVNVRSLAIVGYGCGKGIYLKGLSECNFVDLWIHITNDGAALYLDSTVMETEFRNIHCYNNGSAENKEATLVIDSQQEGDSNNNLHFDKVYILLPSYIGVQIGSEGKKYAPRLIYFSHCFFHGWYPLKYLAPYDLIQIQHCAPQRGVTITESRFTLPGAGCAAVHLGPDTLAQVSNCNFGGLAAKSDYIRADARAKLIATDNCFNTLNQAENLAIRAEKADTIIQNNVFLAGPDCVRIEQPKNSILQSNIFTK